MLVDVIICVLVGPVNLRASKRRAIIGCGNRSFTGRRDFGVDDLETNLVFGRRRGSDGICILGPTVSGRAILENFRANGREVDCFVDPEGKFRKDAWAGLPVVSLGEEDDLSELRQRGLREFAIVSGAASSRSRLFAACCDAGLKPVTLIHPTATVMSDVELGDGVIIGARALVGVKAVIGANCTVGMGSIVNHECSLDDHTTIGARVTLGMQAHIGERTFLGDGVTVLPARRIGQGVVVVSGSVITQDIPADSIVAGVPAKLIRRKRSAVGTEP